jgi:hypothetical protein
MILIRIGQKTFPVLVTFEAKEEFPYWEGVVAEQVSAGPPAVWETKPEVGEAEGETFEAVMQELRCRIRETSNIGTTP